MRDLKGPVEGVIVKVREHYSSDGPDTYTLDNGYQWSDSKGRHKEGDKVLVEPYIMGTVRVTKLSKGE